LNFVLKQLMVGNTIVTNHSRGKQKTVTLNILKLFRIPFDIKMNAKNNLTVTRYHFFAVKDINR